jgi:excisionase family DNA binding protein
MSPHKLPDAGSLSYDSPLAVRPREACRLLSIGNTYLYQLLGAGALESYLDGRARRITMDSIHRHIARRLERVDKCATSKAQPRRRGHPRKSLVGGGA